MMDQLVTAQKRTVEALNEAGKIYAAGVQTYTQTQIELAREAVEDAVAAGKQLMAEKAVDKIAALYVEKAKVGFEKGVAGAKTLGEIVVKTNRDAAELLGKVFAANVEVAKTNGKVRVAA
jgi:phasin family protein